MEILNIKRNEKVTNIEEAKKVNTRHQNSLKKTKVNRIKIITWHNLFVHSTIIHNSQEAKTSIFATMSPEVSTRDELQVQWQKD